MKVGMAFILTSILYWIVYKILMHIPIGDMQLFFQI